METYRTEDYHTAGEPFRIVVEGAPDLPGVTVGDRRAAAVDDPTAQRVRAILHEIDDAEAAAAASTRDLRGTIRIVAAPVLATNFLAPMVALWHAHYPKLMLDISMDDMDGWQTARAIRQAGCTDVPIVMV